MQLNSTCRPQNPQAEFLEEKNFNWIEPSVVVNEWACSSKASKQLNMQATKDPPQKAHKTLRVQMSGIIMDK